jgi:outer membrane murein-binding lipoprotein Lpp
LLFALDPNEAMVALASVVGKLAAGLLASLFVGAAAGQATPISKVLDLMREMFAKGDAAKKDEAVKYAAYNQWCSDQTRVRNEEISSLEGTMEKLSASIEKRAVEIKQLTARVDELDEDVGRWQKDDKATVDIRSKESVDFKSTSLDYTESLSALDEAIGIMKKQAYNRQQGSFVQSLLQIQSSQHLPAAAKAAVTQLLQQKQPEPELPDEKLFNEAPEAYGYEFQSGGVVDMLGKLRADFGNQKRDLESEEMQAQHGHNQMRQVLTDNVENAEHEISRKKTLRAETEKQKADEEGDLAETARARDESRSYLEQMTNMCNMKAADFASRQKLRAEEIKALQMAIEIIGSSSVAGSGEKHLPTFFQARVGNGTSLAQVRSASANPVQGQIAAFLAQRARESGSRLLLEVSQRVAGDPFKKVKKLITDLISKLVQEATAETEHKGWCDTELTTNKQTRDVKTESVNQLSSEIEDLTAEIAQLTQDIADLASGIQELEAAMAKATEERTQSKATNEETIKDAQEAQTAVQQAIAVLKDFYAKSAESTALVQQAPADDAPETFTGPYKGLMPEGGNVVDFLEVVLTDFARLESETAADEAQEAKAHDDFMFESKKDKALKENEKGHKEQKTVDQEGALHSAEAELKVTQEELDSAIAYYEKLKPSCVHSGINYEDRVKLREQEMQSLQEALKVLKNQDIDLD